MDCLLLCFYLTFGQSLHLRARRFFEFSDLELLTFDHLLPEEAVKDRFWQFFKICLERLMVGLSSCVKNHPWLKQRYRILESGLIQPHLPGIQRVL